MTAWMRNPRPNPKNRRRGGPRARTTAAVRLGLTLASSLVLTALTITAVARPAAGAGSADAPNVLLVTIDTLRTDRMSVYGYERPTSPHLDQLLDRGARFTETRTVEPLTNPALSSMITSRYPHEHGGTRNGLRMRRGLSSLPKLLQDRGYLTAAFVGNWTLKHRLSGLGEHFKTYEEVLNKKRWFGLFKGEADAADLTDKALEWLDTYGGRRRPFLLWVHYVEPHAPYHCHEEYFERLGLDASGGEPSKSDCYDTEIAFADHHVGRLLATIKSDPRLDRRTVVVFTADHGESLGEHDYWGHGRNLHEPNLHIPFGVTWPGRIEPQVIDAPALLIDVAPTVLGLLDLEAPESFHGRDWSRVFAGEEVPESRTTWYQAHKGAVLTAREAENARSRGLLQVGLLASGMKEILEVNGHDLQLFDLQRDPRETKSLVTERRDPSDELASWYEQVTSGLEQAGRFPPPALDEESVEQLKALGYGP